jgi:mono/diheme cytochrome c family protein
MFIQPSLHPLERTDAFRNSMASRPLVPNTVARDQLDEDTEFYTGKIGTNLVAALPHPVTREMLDRGQERYNIYCAPCHSQTGNGNGMIVQRGFPRPPSYHIDRLREAPIGHFYDVITHGYGIMYSYAARVEPADRWAIAAYIRVLQTSQNAQVKDIPAADRTKLEAKK